MLLKGRWGEIAGYASLPHATFGSRAKQKRMAAILRCAWEIAIERDRLRLNRP